MEYRMGLVVQALELRARLRLTDSAVLEQMGGMRSLGYENYTFILGVLASSPQTPQPSFPHQYSQYSQYSQFEQPSHLTLSTYRPGPGFQLPTPPALLPTGSTVFPPRSNALEELPTTPLPSQSVVHGSEAKSEVPAHMSGEQLTERVRESLKGE
jgi:hypothetical protein